MSNLDEFAEHYFADHTYLSYAMISPINYSGAAPHANPEFYDHVYSCALRQDKAGRL